MTATKSDVSAPPAWSVAAGKVIRDTKDDLQHIVLGCPGFGLLLVVHSADIKLKLKESRQCHNK